ncbi:MAG TPA: nicotinate phosphoribosyltransferase [Rhabdochlamydiaceae bacterium]|nr:nicotinate phosphoribosyltransferase [Rhabdochlamydiaceae bacterium]
MTKTNYFKDLYQGAFSLLTDLYELTMAYGYWKEGMVDREAVFHLSFRKQPFKGPFAIAAGMEIALDYLQQFQFTDSDLEYLEAQKGENRKPLFEKKFLDYLKNWKLQLDVDAMAEGTVVFPHQPLLRVQGPILQAQIMESILLNIINFQSLIATKAARICWAAKSDPVVEFGLRRAQGIDGAVSASRAAYIGGCESTSHVLAGKLFDIPVKGTMAHSWVMAFEDEKKAFSAFAEAEPNNCIFLVDTYNSIQGTKHAVEVAKELKAKGMKFLGVRLDSGDLTYLSIEIRKILDEGGFPDAKIMASNELDENLISDLKHQGCLVNLWGVGTNLVTGKDQSALDGVYKLSAVKDEKGNWQYKLKTSETMAKVTTPGISQVRRYYNDRGNVTDMLYDIHLKMDAPPTIFDFSDPAMFKEVKSEWKWRDLLIPMMRKGKSIYMHPTLEKMRANTQEELSKFSPRMRRFLNPQPYFAGIEKNLYQFKLNMIEKIQREFD